MIGIELWPGTVVEDTPDWTIAVNRNQNLLGKAMLVLRRPCTDVADIGPAEWAALHAQMGRVAAAQAARFRPDHVNFAFLMNEDAQVHLHVIPRYATTRDWGGRRFADPHWGRAPGPEQRPLRPDDLRRLADELRAALPRPP